MSPPPIIDRVAESYGLTRSEAHHALQWAAICKMAGIARSGGSGAAGPSEAGRAKLKEPPRVETKADPLKVGLRWCDQCEKRVSYGTAEACTDRFCAIKREAGQ